MSFVPHRADMRLADRPDYLPVHSVRLKTSSTSDYFGSGKGARSVPGGAEGGPPPIFDESQCTLYLRESQTGTL